jgi:hypothetical protein
VDRTDSAAIRTRYRAQRTLTAAAASATRTPASGASAPSPNNRDLCDGSIGLIQRPSREMAGVAAPPRVGRIFAHYGLWPTPHGWRIGGHAAEPVEPRPGQDRHQGWVEQLQLVASGASHGREKNVVVTDLPARRRLGGVRGADADLHGRRPDVHGERNGERLGSVHEDGGIGSHGARPIELDGDVREGAHRQRHGNGVRHVRRPVAVKLVENSRRGCVLHVKRELDRVAVLSLVMRLALSSVSARAFFSRIVCETYPAPIMPTKKSLESLRDRGSRTGLQAGGDGESKKAAAQGERAEVNSIGTRLSAGRHIEALVDHQAVASIGLRPKMR